MHYLIEIEGCWSASGHMSFIYKQWSPQKKLRMLLELFQFFPSFTHWRHWMIKNNEVFGTGIHGNLETRRLKGLSITILDIKLCNFLIHTIQKFLLCQRISARRKFSMSSGGLCMFNLWINLRTRNIYNWVGNELCIYTSISPLSINLYPDSTN